MDRRIKHCDARLEVPREGLLASRCTTSQMMHIEYDKIVPDIEVAWKILIEERAQKKFSHTTGR